MKNIKKEGGIYEDPDLSKHLVIQETKEHEGDIANNYIPY